MDRLKLWACRLLSPWIWVEMAGIVVLCVALQLCMAPFVLPWDRRRYVMGRLFRRMGKSVARLSPLWRFGVFGSYPPRLPTRAVVVCNHVSHLDCFLISYLPYEMKWLAKASLFKIPVLGWGMALAGDIPVVRGAGGSIAAAMQRCRRTVESGMPVLIFPEGTRAQGEAMLPFKMGAFRLAIETGAAIVPLAVAGTRRGLPKHSWIFGFSRAYVMVGEPICTANMRAIDAPALCETARRRIGVMLETIAPLSTT